jgi:hypothetical protein
MRALALSRTPHGESVVDLCDDCHALWFDRHESVQLTPGAIVSLFHEVQGRAAPARRGLPERMRCPRCRGELARTQDLRHTTRFTYWRCTAGDGRFTPFVQFLREKSFIRPLTTAEIERLKAHVRTIRCSGCGAPVDLARDMVCSFCRAPVEALDPDAVATTLRSLDDAEDKRKRVDVDALADAIIAAHRRPPRASASNWALDVGTADLIGAGLSILTGGIDG